MNAFLEAALDEARAGFAEGGIPIGSVLVHGGRIPGRGHNRRVQKDSAAHPELWNEDIGEEQGLGTRN